MSSLQSTLYTNSLERQKLMLDRDFEAEKIKLANEKQLADYKASLYGDSSANTATQSTTNASSSNGAVASLFSDDMFEKIKELNQLSLTPEQRDDITFVSDINRETQLDLLNPQLESNEKIANINADTNKYSIDKGTELGKYTTDANNQTQLDLLDKQIAGTYNVEELKSGTDKFIAGLNADTAIATTKLQGDTAKEIAAIDSASQLEIVDKQETGANYRTDKESETAIATTNRQAESNEFAALQNSLSEQYKADAQKDVAGIEADAMKDTAEIQAGAMRDTAGIEADTQKQGFLSQETIAKMSNDTSLMLQEGVNENARRMNQETLANNLDVITRQGEENRLTADQQFALASKGKENDRKSARDLYVARGM